MNQREFHKLLDAYLEGRADAQQQKLLDDFFSSHVPTDPSIGEKEVRDRIWAKFNTTIAQKKNSINIIPIAVAASITLLLATAYIWNALLSGTQQAPQALQQTVETQRGQKLEMKLADGTTVLLNAASKLTYPKEFTGRTREVFLDGEAFFQVQHNPEKPFIVHTLQSNTRVLGTTFNVKAVRGANTEITLIEGKVNVSKLLSAKSQPGPEVNLSPSQQAIIDLSLTRIVKKKIDVTPFIEWKDDVIRFDKTTLKEAIPILEKWYDIDITVEDKRIADCKITATYHKEALANILKSIEYILQVKCERKGKKVLIKGKSC